MNSNKEPILETADEVESRQITHLSSRLRLWVKRLLFPGLDVVTRKRMKFARYFLKGNIATLDAGCGNGAFTYKAYRLGNRCVGINIDPDQIRRCNKYRDFLKLDPSRCQFKVHNIYDMLSLKEKFDQVICFETLEHLKKDQEVLFLFSKVLNPRGILHICTPCLHRNPYYGEVISDVEDGGHVRLGYTYERLSSMLAKAGFEVIQMDSAAGFFSQKIGDIIRKIQMKGLLPEPIRVRFAILLLPLYLLTFFDCMTPYQPLSIYIKARFTKGQRAADLMRAD